MIKGFCYASGDPHLKTFDGARYDVMGTCQYYFVTSKAVSLTHSAFNVKLTNFKHNPGSRVSYVERAIFEFSSRDHNTQYLIELWDYKGAVRTVVEINGEVLVSSEVQNGDMKLVNNGKVAFVETWFGVKVEFKPYYLGVRIPTSYESKVNGLCGNYDGDASNDYRLINGDIMKSEKEGICQHIDAWVVPKAVPGCETGCPDFNCSPSTKVQNACRILKEAFQTCHQYVDPEPYYQDCLGGFSGLPIAAVNWTF